MIDAAYTQSQFRAPEIAHAYGDRIHLLDDPMAWSLLARVGSPETLQPELGRLVILLYRQLAHVVFAAELTRRQVEVPTRMSSSHEEAVYRGLAIDSAAPVITVGIARAGTVPSQTVYELLHQVVEPEHLRQDHLFMSRKTNEAGEVVGTEWHDAKIGREVAGRTILFPDPMGATGSSIISALDHYKNDLDGKPAKAVAMHLMVTPEYVRNVTRAHPDLIVYALRLDRGLSSDRALASIPGKVWDEERGLNDTQYIVPGAGGVGELLNNAWV